MTFHSVGEPNVHFQYDWSMMTRHYQRFQDFSAGMGVRPQSINPNASNWHLQMTPSQKQRWDEWLKTLN